MNSQLSRFMVATMIISFLGLMQTVRAQSWLDVVGEASMNYATSSYMPWDSAHPNSALAYKGAGSLGASFAQRSTLTPAVPMATAADARRVDTYSTPKPATSSAGKAGSQTSKPSTSQSKKVSTAPTSTLGGMSQADYFRESLEVSKQALARNTAFQERFLENQQTGLVLQATQTKIQTGQWATQRGQEQKAGRLNDLTSYNVAANWTGVGISAGNLVLNQIPIGKALNLAKGVIGKNGDGLTVPKHDFPEITGHGQ